MEGKHVADIWKYCIAGFVAIILALIGSCQTTNYQMRKAIENGAPPLSTACVFDSSVMHCNVLEAAEAEAVENGTR